MEAVLAAADDPDASIKKGHVCEVSSVAIPQNWLSPLMQLSEHFALGSGVVGRLAAENEPAKEQRIGENNQRRYSGYRLADCVS